MDIFKGNSILSNGSSKQQNPTIDCDSCHAKKRKCDCIRRVSEGSTQSHIPVIINTDNKRQKLSELSHINGEIPYDRNEIQERTFNEPSTSTRPFLEDNSVGIFRSQREEPKTSIRNRVCSSPIINEISSNFSNDNPDIELILTLEKQLKTERAITMQLLQEQIELGEKLQVLMKLAKDSAAKAEKLSDLIQSYRFEKSNGNNNIANRTESYSPILMAEKRLLDADLIQYSDSVLKRQELSSRFDSNTVGHILPTRESHSPQSTPHNIKIQDCSAKNSLSTVTSVLINQFQRKTRTVLLYPFQNSDFKSSVLTSSLDGVVQGWDLDTRQSILRVSNLEWMPKQNWAEDMQWVSEDTLAVCANKIETNGSQIALINIKKDLSKTLQFKTYYLDSTPHSKSIVVIANYRSIGSRNMKFLTAGLDHKICLWYINSQNQRSSTEIVHDIHTSRINSIFHDDVTNTLYSGSEDKRLIGYSIELQKCLFGKDRLEAGVRDVHPIKQNPHLIIANFVDETIKLFDCRTSTFPLNIKTNSKSTMHQSMSMHQNSNLISLGDATGNLNIWDLRYVNVDKEPAQRLYVDSEIVYAGKFIPNRNSIAALSAHTLNTINYVN